MGIPDNRFRRHDNIGISKALYAGGNIDGLTEVVLPVVEVDCETWSLVDADLQENIVAAVLGIQLKHRLAHPSAAATARSGLGKVAMTASPIVLTTAPVSAATIS